MKKNMRVLNFMLIVLIVIVACNLPSGQLGQELSLTATAAAQTIEALTSSTPTSTSTPAGPGPSPTATATSTPTATATATCNLAEFESDITIPDGTIMTPNQAFTKKWRIKNIGVCAWNGYSLTFDSGDSMSGPASQPIGAVNPGQEVDLAVGLTAPAAAAHYRGYWRIVTNASVLVPVLNGYQGKAFYVDIKVHVPAPPAASQITLSNVAGESGQVRSDGTVLSPVNTGDLASNAVAEAFVSFDMTGIPSGVTVTKVTVDFGAGHDTLGNPWSLGGDGCLRAYQQNYGSPDAGDFVGGDPLGAIIRWCGDGELNSTFDGSADLKSAVQAAVGSSRFQLRIQFRAPTTNSDGIADMVRLGTVKLTVYYQ